MKAWEYIYDLTKNAVPVVLSEDEQTWEASNAAESRWTICSVCTGQVMCPALMLLKVL